MNTFKNGDKVYMPKTSVKIFTIEDIGNDTYQLISDGQSFTSCGRQCTSDTTPSLIRATQENEDLLERLYGVEFEAPIEFVDVRLPLTFKPKIGDTYWMIEPYSDLGYGCSMYDVGRRSDKKAVENGVWRTEEEVKKVANAIFKLNKD